MLFNLIMLAVPVVFLCASAILAVKAFEHGKNRKKTVLTQICSFAAAASPVAALATIGHSVKQSSSLYLVKVSLFTVCSFQFFLSLQDNLSDLSFVKD